eukprot:TRINITY_DN7789_c0_g1_i1.p1 TRINITY_DN7789_c0_g1~~TRINITY_DN7789_c0_g1_i1.p1  ORF type:complete len:207 (+),score=53.78 TRINITY_DN7789_c0_g1_i1:34-654(+)
MSTKVDWDARFSQEEFVYGEEPNVYFKEELDKLETGKILLPAEGEGRNGVYAAKKGWKVFAFDQSVEGKAKAERLAQKHDVSLDYVIADLGTTSYTKDEFDVIAFIYVHGAKDDKKRFYQSLFSSLKPGGRVIAEIFSVKNMPYREKNPSVGGPRHLEYLFTREELDDIFADFKFLSIEEKVVQLKEGRYHDGEGCVFRLVAQKPE